MEIRSIILSAGKGSRMLSSIPKPLHLISGKTMIQWVIDANKSAGIKKSVIVVPKEFDKLIINNKNMMKVIQKKPLGTGDAVKKAIPLLKNFEGIVLICFADTPFITSKTLKKIVKSFNNNELVLTGFKKNILYSFSLFFPSRRWNCLILTSNSDSTSNFLPRTGFSGPESSF